VSTPEHPGLESLLDFLKRNRGFDFTGYKRSSLERRIAKRMQELGIETHGDYVDYLELHQDEFALLFNTILINVTSFFRDTATWDYLRDEVLPELLEQHGHEEPIRVWVAGCASGEEAYSVAMLLASILGEEAYRERVKIYATDVDEEALEVARHASYTAKQVESVPQDLLDRYFDRVESRYLFRQDLRRTVIYGRNDLVQDAPISRIDLLLCRNTLMYFNAETQATILRRFHFALRDSGVLVLGKSEMLITHADLFTPLDMKRRVFRKVVTATMRERLHVLAHVAAEAPSGREDPSMRDSAFDASPAAQLVVDADGVLVLANQAARSQFRLTLSDIGRPVQDLEVSYRPIELRSHIDDVRDNRTGVTIAGAALTDRSGDQRTYDVQITPLTADDELLGVTVTYVDVTAPQILRDELETSRRELEQAYEELQSTVEELETTNEELQSTNEELETTNEELQSTNEELETMNEELQSANEELETMNDELRTRSFELDEVNAFLETILGSMGVAVAVLDADQRVQIWNDHARDLWGLRPDEAQGEHFLGLDIGLPVERLKQPIRALLAGTDGGGQELVLEALNRRGRKFDVRVSCVPLTVADGAINGVILLMADVGAADGDGAAAADASADGDGAAAADASADGDGDRAASDVGASGR
jgi:two-component system CheB/CheR fusion protein